jgi:hypothetical protein
MIFLNEDPLIPFLSFCVRDKGALNWKFVKFTSIIKGQGVIP